MSLFINNQQKVNEIIFANRNKAYGAYVIRSNYGATVFKALGIVIITMLLVSGLLVLLQKATEELPLVYEGNLLPPENIIFVDNTKIYEAPKPPAAESAPKPNTSPQSSSQAVSTQIVDSMPPDSEPQSTLAINLVEGKALAEPSTPGGVENPGTKAPSGNGTGTSSVVSTSGSEPANPFELDAIAEFEGGNKALYQFIKTRIRYPETARINGQDGTLYVKFVVDETGKVGNIILQNNLGYGLDEEAVRVVKLIPPFKKAAMAKGQPVKSYYQLPIRFKMEGK